MKNREFVDRLNLTFEGRSMAEVGRMLDLPHATVRNYYIEGRLPAPEVLIKVANVTNVSLNWLLTGKGNMHGERMPAVSIGNFIEYKIAEMIDKRLAGETIQDLGSADAASFELDNAINEFNDPQKVMDAWFAFERREYPNDYGVDFFRGWQSFSAEEKRAALIDAKRMLDRSLRSA
ncbi:MAG TPA: helix-turn-helix domain-containing protein [Pyrinomonadaceae bacterium]|nr:helix-turn-helix domain-containing protein [Pyrinomonadaceae bacterium]